MEVLIGSIVIWCISFFIPSIIMNGYNFLFTSEAVNNLEIGFMFFALSCIFATLNVIALFVCDISSK